MYFGAIILLLKLACCLCYVAYEMFQGFDVSPDNTTTDPYVTSLIIDKTLKNMETQVSDLGRVSKYDTQTKTSYLDRASKIDTQTEVYNLDRVSKVDTQTEASYLDWVSKFDTQIKAKLAMSSVPPTTVAVQTTVVPPVTPSKYKCPENEEPSNIGAYEVPTQRDIVLLVRSTLMRMFNTYNEKALDFLKDIKEVTRATKALEINCHGYGTDRNAYRKCVRQVSYKCEVITKGLVSSLESQRKDVEAFTNGSICNVKGMKADPVELIKTLAKEEVSLEFALPGFLRLLNACSSYCKTMQPLEQLQSKKPVRHMTDQDLVVKHFLTKKNYIQLLKGSK